MPIIFSSSNLKKEAELHTLILRFVSNLNSIDLFIANESSYGIKQIKEYLHWLSLMPIGKNKRTLVIRNAHEISLDGQNALLKTLEEFAHTQMIILETAKPDFLLSTILSRCVLEEATYIPSPQDLSFDLKPLKSLDNHNILDWFKWSAKLSPDRENAVQWLDKTIIYLHDKISNPGIPSKIKRLLMCKTHLQANCNTCLALENLIFKW